LFCYQVYGYPFQGYKSSIEIEKYGSINILGELRYMMPNNKFGGYSVW
jgi:hypothetical protein